MQTENNKVPLYKVLNSERTQGEWMAKTYGNGFCNRIETTGLDDTTIADCYHEGKEPNWRWMREPISHIQAEANAQYTALAVNNLNNMATALELCCKLFKAMEEQMPDLPLLGHIAYQMTRDSAKEALKAIS